MPSAVLTAVVRRTVCIDSPLGPLRATATDRGLAQLHLPPHRDVFEQDQPGADGAGADGAGADGAGADGAGADAFQHGVRSPAVRVLAAVREQLAAYFAGDLVEFDLPLDLGGSAHQEAVWALLRDVPYGQTTTYKSLAVRLGKPGASRAVGSANARNPVAIIVPCHRVIGSDGLLTGYAAGLPNKRWLLSHEQERQGAALF